MISSEVMQPGFVSVSYREEVSSSSVAWSMQVGVESLQVDCLEAGIIRTRFSQASCREVPECPKSLQ